MYIEITSYNILMNSVIFNEIQYFPIADFDKYYISRCGKILSFKCKKPKILSSGLNRTTGYIQYGLQKNNKRETKDLHRLLAMTFLSDFSAELQVDHKDNVRLNNNLSNLHMVTASDNQRNKIQVRGVRLYTKHDQSYYYRTHWCDENSILHDKLFLCNIYGYIFAYILALDHRAEMVELYYNRECKIWIDYLYLDNCECI